MKVLKWATVCHENNPLYPEKLSILTNALKMSKSNKRKENLN